MPSRLPKAKLRGSWILVGGGPSLYVPLGRDWHWAWVNAHWSRRPVEPPVEVVFSNNNKTIAQKADLVGAALVPMRDAEGVHTRLHEIFEELCRRHGISANTGLCAAVWMLEQEIDKLWITGFDFYAGQGKCHGEPRVKHIGAFRAEVLERKDAWGRVVLDPTLGRIMDDYWGDSMEESCNCALPSIDEGHCFRCGRPVDS